MGKTIRIPRTTALFVTGLGRILRDELGLVITEHEHWTFDHRCRWEECSYKGDCATHGMAPRPSHSDDVAPELRAFDYDMGLNFCDPYVMNVYLANGRARVRGKEVQLRARIEHTHCDAMGDCYGLQFWLRDEAGTMTTGVFGFQDDGAPYRIDDATCPEQPPARIAFWKSAEELVDAMV